jgi:hypothetical protein
VRRERRATSSRYWARRLLWEAGQLEARKLPWLCVADHADAIPIRADFYRLAHTSFGAQLLDQLIRAGGLAILMRGAIAKKRLGAVKPRSCCDRGSVDYH